MNDTLKKEIVITADTTKAKTSLQRLADYMKKVLAEEETTKLDLNTTEVRAKLVQVNAEISRLKSEIKTMSPDDKAFGEWAKELENAEIEATKLKDALQEVNTETNTSGNVKELGNALEKAGKKSRKFVLSLFSVRSVWLLISKASRQYMSENEDVTNKVAGAWSYLGNLLGPIIEKIVSWLQYGIAYLNVFLKALTGIDFLAKSIQKSTAKANKEAKKTLSEMDEIVNLDLDKGNNAPNTAGALQDIADLKLNPKIVEFLEKLAEVLKVVWDWAKKAWDFLEKHFGTIGAAAIVGGIALILGSAATGGLWGMVAALTAIAGVELATVISKLKELQTAVDKEQEATRRTLATQVAVYNYYKKQYELADNEKDRAYYAERMETAYNNMADNLQDFNGDLNKTVELTGKWKDYYDNTKPLADQIAEATKSANNDLNKMDGKTANVKLKIGADLTEAERSSSDWFRRLSYKLNDWLTNFNKGVTNVMHGKKWNAYATGGFPDEGQMFIANENGPELVGNIGSSTAVVNNQQIVDSVSQGVASAVAGVLGSQKSTSQNATYLYINGSEFAKAVYNDMQTESQRRNTNTSIRRA